VKVAAAPDESVALLMDGVLKDAGIPSLIQRAVGFDAPDFLSAGPMCSSCYLLCLFFDRHSSSAGLPR
jgi:hypothetical protein